MKLVVETQVLIKTHYNKLQYWTDRQYFVQLSKRDFIEPTDLDSIVHRVACKVEKHKMNFHETLKSWYVVPDSEILKDNIKMLKV